MNPSFLIVPITIALGFVALKRRRVQTQEMIQVQYPGARASGDVPPYKKFDSEIDEALASGEYETGTSDYGAMLDEWGSARNDFNIDLPQQAAAMAQQRVPTGGEVSGISVGPPLGDQKTTQGRTVYYDSSGTPTQIQFPGRPITISTKAYSTYPIRR